MELCGGTAVGCGGTGLEFKGVLNGSGVHYTLIPLNRTEDNGLTLVTIEEV